jgi:hypothetical protein
LFKIIYIPSLLEGMNKSFWLPDKNWRTCVNPFPSISTTLLPCQFLEDGKPVLQLFKATQGLDMELKEQLIMPSTSINVQLKIKANGAVYTFSFQPIIKIGAL